jgi:AcrR family transcriptional regulator
MSEPASKPRKRDITRARVIQAAIDCIYREGFNAAHTNKIAEEAGVTWGVLQYHFGDKDGLMQAVLDSIFASFAQALAESDIRQADLPGRIDALIELFWSLVSKPDYRVSAAILRNAGRDPESAVEGVQQMDTWAGEIANAWDEIFSDIAVAPERSRAARRVMFAALRGLADDINPSDKTRRNQLKDEFSALSEAIHYLLTT